MPPRNGKVTITTATITIISLQNRKSVTYLAPLMKSITMCGGLNENGLLVWSPSWEGLGGISCWRRCVTHGEL